MFQKSAMGFQIVEVRLPTFPTDTGYLILVLSDIQKTLQYLTQVIIFQCRIRQKREDLCSIFLHRIIVRYVKEQGHCSSNLGVLPCLLHPFCVSVGAVIPCQVLSCVVDDKLKQLGLKILLIIQR